jgi:hypothetical protein
MFRPPVLLAGLAVVLLGAWTAPAAAQGMGSWGRQAPGVRVVEPPPPLANPPRPDTWPRLDPGAVLCRTQEDLARRSTAVATRAAGGEAPLMTGDCQIVSSRTGIEVLRRAGPGRTEVRLTNPAGRTGWTDAWLPERAPR